MIILSKILRSYVWFVVWSPWSHITIVETHLACMLPLMTKGWQSTLRIFQMVHLRISISVDHVTNCIQLVQSIIIWLVQPYCLCPQVVVLLIVYKAGIADFFHVFGEPAMLLFLFAFSSVDNFWILFWRNVLTMEKWFIVVHWVNWAVSGAIFIIWNSKRTIILISGLMYKAFAF